MAQSESPFALAGMFLARLVHHWAALATGGVIMAGIWAANSLVGWQIPSSVNVFFAITFFGIAAFQTWKEERLKVTALESKALELPPNHIHVALDRLYELDKIGETMLANLRLNIQPIPRETDVADWADNLASVASSIGTYGDKSSFFVHYRFLGLPPPVLDVKVYPPDRAELAKSIQAKRHLTFALISRLSAEEHARNIQK